MSVDVLLTGAVGKVGDAVLKDLRSRGLEAEVSDIPADAVSFPELVRSTGARMVMPVFYPEKLAAAVGRLPEGVIAAVDSADKLLLLDDKVNASALASRLGINQPRMYSTAADVERWPCVFKRATGLGGSGVYFPRTAEALERLMATSGATGAQVMDYVQGADYSVDALRWDGYFRGEAYKVLLPHGKGTSFLRRSVTAPRLVEVARAMLDELDYHGVCGFDFRVTPDGNAFFLEANPRFSGGVRTQIMSGFDQPYLLWRLASGLQAGESVFRPGRYCIDAADARRWIAKQKS